VNTKKSSELFEKAKALIPGGVNSPVRAFKSVGGVPRFIDRGEGAYVWDVDGNRYIDYVLSWGPLALGHAHPVVVSALAETAARGTSFGAPTQLENELAELIIGTIPSIDMIRFVNSGTEATMSALRLARAYTGRDKIVKFAGCYHGHSDMLLVQAGSGVATLGLPDSPGVPAGAAGDTLLARYNDLADAKEIFAAHGDAVAAVIVEPIAGNMGFVKGEPEFLAGLRKMCNEYGALLIFDEVMTGFRAARGGAQELVGMEPDLTCLGKVIGGGLPVGAYGGKKAIMETVAPAGPMYQAGTLSGNPLAVSAGLATLRALLAGDTFADIEKQTAALVTGIRKIAGSAGVPMQAGHAGTMFGFYFLKEDGAVIRDFASAKQYADTERYGMFFHAMLESGVYFAPSQFEAGFVSSEHGSSDIDTTLGSMKTFIENEVAE